MGILNTFVDFLESFQPGPEKIRKDMVEIREGMKETIESLIPLTGPELELLSLHPAKKEKKRGFGHQINSTFSSIYHEPMVAYAIKKYLSGKKNFLLYARTNKREYAFRVKATQTQVFMNGSPMGVLVEDHKLYGGRRNRLIARINISNDRYWPILVVNKEVAHLINPEKAEKVSPRVFLFTREMDTSEESVVLALSLYRMIISLKEYKKLLKK